MSQVVTLPAGRVRSQVRPLVGIDFGLRPFRKAERTKSSATQAPNLTTSGAADRAGFFEQFFGFKRALEPGSGAFTLMSNDEDFVLPLIKPKKPIRSLIRKPFKLASTRMAHPPSKPSQAR